MGPWVEQAFGITKAVAQIITTICRSSSIEAIEKVYQAIRSFNHRLNIRYTSSDRFLFVGADVRIKNLLLTSPLPGAGRICQQSLDAMYKISRRQR
jgi:hypothetical protein